MTMMKRFFFLCLFLAATFGLVTSSVIAQTAQQLAFAGLLSSGHQGQFNGIQSDASGNLYLLLDQKDGVRILKTDPTASNVLAQAHIGAHGDIGLALCLDPAGNIYVTGTTTSGSLAGTLGSAFPAVADSSVNSFIAKFDSNLNTLFITFAGTGRTAAAAIAATSDAVFITGSTFSNTLPATPSAILQSPATGSFQNGFVERFNSTGTALIYATYLTGLNGNTAPAALTTDSSDNAYIAGYTTSSGFPTLAAVVPVILSNASGFLTKLTPAGDGITFSTFIPGNGITSLAIDPTSQSLLLSGNIAPGQFPVTSISAPLASTSYQTAVRMPLDGGNVLSSTLLAPGTQSTIAPDASGNLWAAVSLTTPLLPVGTLSTIGNSALLHINSQATIDQAVRFGGLPTTNPGFASLPISLTAVASDPIGQPVAAGSVSPTASSSLLATETYDLALENSPTPALPSTLRDAALPPGSCTGSLCAGSAAFLARLNLTSAPALALSADNFPNITLRNLGSATATNLQLSTTGFILSHDCPTQLPAGSECDLVLSGTGSGTLTAQATNAATQTVSLPSTSTTPNPIAVSPHELDFGIQTFTSPAAIRTLTITNLSQQTQTFTSDSASAANVSFAEQSSDCAAAGPSTKSLAAGASCHISIAFTPSGSSTNDGPLESNWTIGAGNVLLTAFSQAASLNVSALDINFGTQFLGQTNLNLPRYLYISNNSTSPITHATVALPSTSSFTITDRCPTTLEPHTICQLQLTYLSPQTSSDSVTLTLDQGLTVLITGQTIPQPGVNGATANPNLAVTPTTISFPNPVVVTGTSISTRTVTVSNTSTQAFPLSLTLSGDFSDSTNCASVLARGASCSVVLTFAPSQPGVRQGLLSVTAGAGTTPVYVNLSGTGTSVISANNGILNFGNVVLNQPDVIWYKITQPFTNLTASTPAPDFSILLVEDTGYGHGNPPASTFEASASGTCYNCWLGIQFRPSQPGLQTATLSLSSNTTGNPYSLTLTGTGIPLSGLLLTPTQSDFGPVPVNSTSAPTLFTLTNYTQTTANVAAPTTTGDYAVSTAPTGGATCNGPLVSNTSCFIEVTFAPTATGPRAGTLVIASDTTVASANLTGYGSPDPGVSLNPTALVFSNIPGPTSTQQTIKLTNTGIYTLQISTPSSSSNTFQPSANCNVLAPGAACTITVTFTPTTYTVTDSLTISVTSTAPSSPTATYLVPLTGAYTTEDSGLEILPSEADYGPTSDTTLGLTRQFTINNLTSKSLTLALALPRQFALAEPPCSALSPNASCTFSVEFIPLTNGDITGTLFAQATPTDGSATVNGLGYVEGYGIGSGALTIAGNILPGRIINFGQVASGQSAAQTLILTNSGSAPLTVRRVLSEWPFLSTTTCGATLTAAQSCTVTIIYSPLNQVAPGSSPAPFNTDSGSLIIESDAASSPDIVDLSGTTTPAVVASPSNVAPLASYTASQNSLTFAATSGGNASSPRTITLANTGTTTIHITALKTTPDFTITGACPSIVPGASCPITIAFTPQAASSQTTMTIINALEILSDSSASLDFISLLGTATPSTLVLSPVSLNFGSVLVGKTATLPVQVTNASPNAATFASITSTGDYVVSGDCPSADSQLAPNTSCNLQISFAPTQSGIRPGTVSLATSLTTLPLTVQLIGTGTQSQLQITPASLNFSSIAVSASANQTLSLSNTGTAPINGLSLAITGDYAITVPCALTVLAPGERCAVTVTFTPTAIGTRTGALTISSSGQAPTTVPLTGNGVPNGAFALTVNNGSSGSATVKSGQPASYSLTLTPQNGFTGTVVFNCTPVNPGQFATCSLLPSSVNITNSTPQNAVATINTVTESTSAQTHSRNSHKYLVFLLPVILVSLTRKRLTLTGALAITLFSAISLTVTGCGSGGTVTINNGNPNLRYTPPGNYQYQVAATSTTGVQLTQTVTLNLTVTTQ